MPELKSDSAKKLPVTQLVDAIVRGINRPA